LFYVKQKRNLKSKKRKRVKRKRRKRKKRWIIVYSIPINLESNIILESISTIFLILCILFRFKDIKKLEEKITNFMNDLICKGS